MKRVINIFPAAVKLAVKEAKKSTYFQPVGAVIIRKKTILSSGHNYAHKSAKKLHPKFQKWKYSIHAEVDCILKARTDLSGATIYVIRLGKNGQFLLSRPCSHCLSYLKHVGIKKVYYSTNKYPYMVMENI